MVEHVSRLIAAFADFGSCQVSWLKLRTSPTMPRRKQHANYSPEKQRRLPAVKTSDVTYKTRGLPDSPNGVFLVLIYNVTLNIYFYQSLPFDIFIFHSFSKVQFSSFLVFSSFQFFSVKV